MQNVQPMQQYMQQNPGYNYGFAQGAGPYNLYMVQTDDK